MEKYRIAIFGDTGVGKTYFLASYCYASKYSNKTRFSAEPNPNSQIFVENLTKNLFGEIMPGTDKRQNITFEINKLDMSVTLCDLRGADTTAYTQDVDNELLRDLRDADAVIIFLSAYDVLHNTDDVKLNQIGRFQNIIYNVIKKQNKNFLAGTDLPFYFIFTQGDKVEKECDDESELMEKLGRIAKDVGYSTDSHTRWRPWKRQNSKAFITASLGKWTDNRPPAEDEYTPLNVVESMESLLIDMKNARHSWRKYFIKKFNK